MIWYQESTSLPPRGHLASDRGICSPLLSHHSPSDGTTHRGSSALSGLSLSPLSLSHVLHYDVSLVIFTCSPQSEICLAHHPLINQGTWELPPSSSTLLAPLGKSPSFHLFLSLSLNSLYLISITCLTLHYWSYLKLINLITHACIRKITYFLILLMLLDNAWFTPKHSKHHKCRNPACFCLELQSLSRRECAKEAPTI